jgi:hypothetical protein
LPAYESIAGRLKKRFRIRFLCTDGNYAYDKIKVADKHIVGKSELTLLFNEDLIMYIFG